ncbi:MAG: type II toxin-antitoxin system RelE/ParE family toxin [Marinospirillum sp.]|uniref:type II toxin-antitoxin system RelE/ParE family toxin n=1 Tax=Marinospirillum sp. TaxID=2183934 RepID=UPI0019E1ECC9|nr:type II toxin-antitoxin system RelE/ParE family toxin [Marinospirillum sp.]MBE0506124.1 type II toxin-antitoxin system RelE/ParE family toxin [Marinospirillum sp.]
MRIFKNAWFERFAKKEKLTEVMLLNAIRQAEKGLVDADLGQGVIKLRIARPNQGKSGGYRSVVLYLKGQRAFFVYGFAKSKQDNIREDEKQAFKAMAMQVLALSDEHIEAMLANKQFFEVKGHE